MMKTKLILAVALLTFASFAVAAYREPATVLGLTNPVSVAFIGGCPDGGSTKGKLVDASGKEYHFFIDRRLKTETRGRWYVDAEFNTGKAELLAGADGRIGAIYGIVVAWLNNVTTAEQRTRLAQLDETPKPKVGLSPEAKLQEHAKWFIVHDFMKAKE